jgi:hypothetical protein
MVSNLVVSKRSEGTRKVEARGFHLDHHCLDTHCSDREAATDR